MLPDPVGQQLVRSVLRYDLSFLPRIAIDELAVYVVEVDYAVAGRLSICTDAVIVDSVSAGPVPAVTRHPTVFFP